MLCLLVQPNYETKLTLFSEIIRKDGKPDKPMTAAEIKEMVIRKLLGSREVKRNGHDGLHAGRADSAG